LQVWGRVGSPATLLACVHEWRHAVLRDAPAQASRVAPRSRGERSARTVESKCSPSASHHFPATMWGSRQACARKTGTSRGGGIHRTVPSVCGGAGWCGWVQKPEMRANPA